MPRNGTHSLWNDKFSALTAWPVTGSTFTIHASLPPSGSLDQEVKTSLRPSGDQFRGIRLPTEIGEPDLILLQTTRTPKVDVVCASFCGIRVNGTLGTVRMEGDPFAVWRPHGREVLMVSNDDGHTTGDRIPFLIQVNKGRIRVQSLGPRVR